MKKTLIGAAVVLVLWSVVSYNGLVDKQEAVDSSYAQIENVLQRRYDLIPNFVATVKGYAKHERETLEEVTRLRSQWGAASSRPDKLQAAGQLEGALSRLMVISESYPQLKADRNFSALQDELAGSENRISVERKRYNDAVNVYNRAVRRFPSNVTAGLFGFERNKPYFEAVGHAKSAPRVEF
ncbi:MAG: LemA family protein [Elusimicrobia bacterium]|nr:LemA family protein [Elusimicrobiota bacterium]